MVLNLGLLGFFKYYNLIAETLNLIPFINLPDLNVTLPIGISFYTFQTMSYPIDVYRGDADVQKNYISFGTFVALFPQLIAGPIVRYKDVADQLGFRASSVDQFASGVERFMIGVGKKVLIANNIGALWDVYAASCGDLTFVGSWIGAAAFSGLGKRAFWRGTACLLLCSFLFAGVMVFIAQSFTGRDILLRGGV